MDEREIVEALGLEPHVTCGWFSLTYRGPFGAALYFVIAPDKPGLLHHLDVDQIYHFYAGAPLEVLVVGEEGPVVRTLGPFGTPGCDPQLQIPAGTVHASRTTGAFTLACTTSFTDHPPTERTHTLAALAARFPDRAGLLTGFAEAPDAGASAAVEG